MSEENNKLTNNLTDDQGPAGLKESIGIKPTFSNITNVTAAGDVTRISFGESYGGLGSSFHTSVVLPTQAALELAALIQKVVGAHQKRVEQEANVIDPKGSIN